MSVSRTLTGLLYDTQNSFRSQASIEVRSKASAYGLLLVYS